MLNILIIDDEKPARDRMRRLLDAIPRCSIMGEAASGAEALERIQELSPEVLLLDISMPGMDGMSLARVLQEGGAAPAVIFCTAYQDQALKAFEVEAVDYLVKPVRAERLEKALLKARRFLGREDSEAEEHYVRSTVGGKVVLTPVHRVICLLSEDKYFKQRISSQSICTVYGDAGTFAYRVNSRHNRFPIFIRINSAANKPNYFPFFFS